MGSCEGPCQESCTTCTTALAQMVGQESRGCRQRADPATNCSPEETPLFQEPRGLGPRLGTFGTFGLEGRGPRHHLLFLFWGQAWVGERIFPFPPFSEQILPCFLPPPGLSSGLLILLSPATGPLTQKVEAGGKE